MPGVPGVPDVLIVDLVLAAVLIGYAVSGFRQGVVVSVLSLLGFVGGGALAMWGLPTLLARDILPPTGDLGRALVIVAGVLIAASIGQAIGVAIGGRARQRVRERRARLLDSVLGAVASVVAVSVLVWLVAGALRTGPSAVLARSIAGSRLVQAIDQVAPPDTGRVFAGFRQLIDAQGFPRVFSGFGPERIRDVEAPDQGVTATGAVRAVAAGVVKVTGLAPDCDRGQEGSGWVVSRGRVVTNAHVVAGVDRPQVQIGGVGRSYAGRMVLFDPVRDLAVLDVPDLPARPLRLGSDVEPDATAVVAGFPLDGPYRLDAARVRDVITARGEDIYGSGISVRRVYSLFAIVQPGNSGGPLLSPSGQVVGVVFAKSLDDDSTAYALTLEEAAPVLRRAADDLAPVDSGACVAG